MAGDHQSRVSSASTPSAGPPVFSGFEKDELKTIDLTAQEIAKEQLLQLKLISLKLNILQSYDEVLVESDLDEFEEIDNQ